jgi:DNA-directed RNA polymerase specialized sigma24 family protein
MLEDVVSGSVTHWLRQLREDEASRAEQALLERYFERLAGVARKHLRSAKRRAADEEDVALSVLDSFFQAARQGRYPELGDRTRLWPLLAKIAACKAIKQSERETAQKRGGGKTRGDSALGTVSDEIAPLRGDYLGRIPPGPETIVELKELVDHLLGTLDDATLRLVAQRKLEGYRNPEIAQELDVSPRTIERKLLRIRTLWSMELPQ